VLKWAVFMSLERADIKLIQLSFTWERTLRKWSPELVGSEEAKRLRSSHRLRILRILNPGMERGGTQHTFPSVCDHSVGNDDDDVHEQSDDLKLFRVVFHSHLNRCYWLIIITATNIICFYILGAQLNILFVLAHWIFTTTLQGDAIHPLMQMKNLRLRNSVTCPRSHD